MIMNQMSRLTLGDYNTNKTEFIKKEFETVCNDVIDIHPYAELAKGISDGGEKIEPLPEPQALSSSSGFLSNNLMVSSAAEEEHHTV